MSLKEQINQTLVGETLVNFKLPVDAPKSLSKLYADIDCKPKEAQLQYSVHSCPMEITQKIGLVFPEIIDKEKKLLIIPAYQNTSMPLLEYGDDTQAEMDAKRHLFLRWGAEFVGKIKEKGYWADITDPMSGKAVFTRNGTSIYPEVKCGEILLGYNTQDVGGCRVLTHPTWNSNLFLATAFTLAPLDLVKQAISSMQ